MSNEEIKKSIINHFENCFGVSYSVSDIFYNLSSDAIIYAFIEWHKQHVFERYAENLNRIESMQKMLYNNVIKSTDTSKSIESGFRLGYNTCLEIIKEDFDIWTKNEAEADRKR